MIKICVLKVFFLGFEGDSNLFSILYVLFLDTHDFFSQRKQKSISLKKITIGDEKQKKIFEKKGDDKIQIF